MPQPIHPHDTPKTHTAAVALAEGIVLPFGVEPNYVTSFRTSTGLWMVCVLVTVIPELPAPWEKRQSGMYLTVGSVEVCLYAPEIEPGVFA